MTTAFTKKLALAGALLLSYAPAQSLVVQAGYFSSPGTAPIELDYAPGCSDLPTNWRNLPVQDSFVLAHCETVLNECLNTLDCQAVQIAVVDANTSELMAWTEGVKSSDAVRILSTPTKQFCNEEGLLPFYAARALAVSGISLEDSVDTGYGVLELDDGHIIRDYNWRSGGYGKTSYRTALLRKSRIAMYKAITSQPGGMDLWNTLTQQQPVLSALRLTEIFNDLYGHETAGSTLKTENVYVREIAAGMFHEGSFYYKVAPRDVSLVGNYQQAVDENTQTYFFVGRFPAESPRYTLSIVMRRPYEKLERTTLLSAQVNKLISLLCQQ